VVSHGIALCVLRGLLRGLDHAELAALDRPQGVVIELEAGAERLLS
jgi:broad specificity phosphatase PhoE